LVARCNGCLGSTGEFFTVQPGDGSARNPSADFFEKQALARLEPKAK
jgi:hypothetical protein